MKRRLKKTEKVALSVVGIIIVLICLQLAWIGPTRAKIRTLQRRIKDKTQYLVDAKNLKQEYLALEEGIRQYRKVIQQRRPDFSLKQFINGVESGLNFRYSWQGPEYVKRLGPEYKRTTIECKYTGKTLAEIVEYLYRIENPQNAIIIDNFNLKPSSDGKKFDIPSIKLSVVTSVEQNE